MKWFNNPETLEDLKKQYKKLAFQNHPDRGGKTSDMQEINAEYEALFSRLKDTHKNAEGEFYTARTATTETATEFMDIIEKLIHMEGIEIEVCGSWVWVTGDTRPHKEELKALSFRWSSNKSAWYFHRDGYKNLNGWKKYAEDHNADDFDEYDGISADCIMQYAIFGEVIYG